MQYSFEYTKQFRYHNKENIEYFINYNGHDEGVVDFIKRTEHKIVIIIGDTETTYTFLANDSLNKYIELLKEKQNFIFSLPFDDCGISLSQKMYESQLPFFFNFHSNSWDIVVSMLNLHAKEVYVCEELAFDLPNVSKIIRQNGALVRVIPNICQTAGKGLPTLKQFFIRPEDVDIYEDYVDILEFWGKKSTYNVLYETYALKEKWNGPLNEIIIGLEDNVDSRYILPDFGKTRLHCNKRCLKGKRCNMCETIKDFANNLQKNNMKVKTLKNN
jgi:hypothetical protein